MSKGGIITDEMLIKSNIACRVVSKLIEKKIEECGYDVEVHLQNLSIQHNERNEDAKEGATFILKLCGFIPETELNKLITKLGY